MSKKNRERRTGESAPAAAGGGGGGTGLTWLPIVLAVGALGLGFWAATDVKKIKDDTAKHLADVDQRLGQLQTMIGNLAKPKPSQGPDPNKVYTVKTEGSPTHGNPSAPIVIAEFSDYQ